MTTRNPNNLSPVPEYPERSRQTYDTINAQNGRRRGSLQAEEGLGDEPGYRNAFGQGAAFSRDGSSHQSYDAIRAGQENGRGRLGSGQEIPAWNAVDPAQRAGFWQGTDGTEQSVTARPMPRQARPGSNPNTITPLHGLLAGERPGTDYQTTIGHGGRRRNQADVTDL